MRKKRQRKEKKKITTDQASRGFVEHSTSHCFICCNFHNNVHHHYCANSSPRVGRILNQAQEAIETAIHKAKYALLEIEQERKNIACVQNDSEFLAERALGIGSDIT